MVSQVAQTYQGITQHTSWCCPKLSAKGKVVLIATLALATLFLLAYGVKPLKTLSNRVKQLAKSGKAAPSQTIPSEFFMRATPQFDSEPIKTVIAWAKEQIGGSNPQEHMENIGPKIDEAWEEFASSYLDYYGPSRDPWKDPGLLAKADRLIKFRLASGLFALMDLSEKFTLNQTAPEDYLKNQDELTSQLLELAFCRYRNMRSGYVVVKHIREEKVIAKAITPKNELKGLFEMQKAYEKEANGRYAKTSDGEPLALPESATTLFYEEGSVPNSWRILFNALARNVSGFVNIEALNQDKQPSEKWAVSQDLNRKEFTSSLENA